MTEDKDLSCGHSDREARFGHSSCNERTCSRSRPGFRVDTRAKHGLAPTRDHELSLSTLTSHDRNPKRTRVSLLLEGVILKQTDRANGRGALRRPLHVGKAMTGVPVVTLFQVSRTSRFATPLARVRRCPLPNQAPGLKGALLKNPQS